MYSYKSFSFPEIGWLKGNIDGASKGNPRPSSIIFCIRNHGGDLVVAKGC